MNDLSWLLYAADVAGQLNAVAGFVAVVGGVSGFFASVVMSDGNPTQSRKTFKTTAIVVSILALITIVTPSRDTLYAIAASEVGEEALKSETAGKALDAINAWLDRQLAPPENNP